MLLDGNRSPPHPINAATLHCGIKHPAYCYLTTSKMDNHDKKTGQLALRSKQQ